MFHIKNDLLFDWFSQVENLCIFRCTCLIIGCIFLFMGHAGTTTPEPPSVIVIQYPLGRRLELEVPPRGLWRTQFYLPDPRFIKFNFTVSSTAVIGMYGRRDAQPSHTQYDFFHVLDGQKTALTKTKRGRQRRMLPAVVRFVKLFVITSFIFLYFPWSF